MFKVPAILTGFSSKQDGSSSVRFNTQELTDEDFLILKKHHGKYGWLLFRENEIDQADIPKEDAEDRDKSPSKRQKAVLFKIWKQNGEPTGDFNTYYRQRMEKNIDRLKTELD